MKNFKTIFYACLVGLVVFAGTNFYFSKQLGKQRIALRKEREKNTEIVNTYNEKIGEYQTTIAIQDEDLKKSSALSDSQTVAIGALEKDLNAKIEMISSLTIQMDSLRYSGNAVVTIVKGDTLTYTIKEHRNGIGLDFTLNHPQGTYFYTIKHDPLKMEVYLSKDKNTGVKIGTIRFPNNPNISVTGWDILYDPDTRQWYQKFWDDISMQAGLFAGPEAGAMAMVGYKKISIGPVLTESGTSAGILYKIK